MYLTGRDQIALESAAAEVTERGGRGIGILCDHAVDSLFRRVREEQSRIDLLVNNVWGGYGFTDTDGRQPSPFEVPAGMALD